jgi:hypothetical protein
MRATGEAALAAKDDYTPANRIKEAARDLGMTGALVQLSAADAAEARRRTEEQFLYPGLEWWFERLKSGRSFWGTSRGWNPVDEIAEMVVDAPVWLLPVYDDNGEVFLARMPCFIDILRRTSLDEYALVPPDLSWLLMVNHHDCLYGVGERVEAHLSRIKRRPGGNGVVVKNYPPEQG